MEKVLTGYPSIDKPWLKYYSEESINAPLPECSIYEYLENNNRDYPRDIALLYLGNRITFGKLFKMIDNTAASFCALGVKSGEIVTVALPSIPEALYAVYALNKIGAVANMIHPLAGEKELVNYLNEAESRTAVVFDGTYDIIKDSLQNTSLKHTVVVSAGESLPYGIKQAYFMMNKRPKLNRKAGQMRWSEFINNGANTPVPEIKKDPRGLALISHTGGTTGEPKGVMCSDRSCNALMWQLLCEFTYKRQECSLCVLPPFINYSLLESVMAMLAVGFQVALIPKYDQMAFDRYIKRYRPNQILSIPSYWEALMKIDDIEKVDMSCFKHLYAGGEKMEPAIEEKLNELIKKCGAKTKIFNGIGSTEMMAGATIIYDNCYTPGSVGIPMVKVNCKIVKPGSDEELTYNQEGEICFFGETMMLGYYNKPDATNEVIKFHNDGSKWLHTGDLGYINEDGVLFISGRIKRIAMTKGKDGNITKIFPDRIEKTICMHPSVSICCVICVPDEERINYPKAFVIANEGVDPSDKLTEEIMELCKNELPEYMIPDGIEYRDDLPRTPRGKIDYRALENEEKQSE